MHDAGGMHTSAFEQPWVHISGAASPVSASRHRGLRVTPAMAVPALKSSRKPATKAQAAQTHHEAWIQHSRVHAMS